MLLYGYPRENGTIGFRNHILVLPTVICAEKTARIMAEKAGVSIAHNFHGCGHIGEDYKIAKRTLEGVGKNPNVAAVLVVALGCEKINGMELAQEISRSGKPVEVPAIQKDGGTVSTIEKGINILERWKSELENIKRVPVGMEALLLGVKCGGSDTFSGIIANPVVGITADKVVSMGGTVLLGEVTEFIGAEQCLVKRAANEEIAYQIKTMVNEYEKTMMSYGVDIRGTQPSLGNIEGGLTTIEEKSLGAIHKGGRSPIQEVILYGQKPSKRGLVIMDGPSQDVVCNTGMTASGAQIILFTTGLGTPVGSPIAPVVKITGTPETGIKMGCNMDYIVKGIINGTNSIEKAGEELFSLMLEILNGKMLCCAEKLGFDEFDFYRTSVNP